MSLVLSKPPQPRDRGLRCCLLVLLLASTTPSPRGTMF